MNVVVIGANGQLGMDVLQAFADIAPTGLTHEQIEISDIDSVSTVLSRLKPTLVINTAAYHKVDDCEKYPEKAFAVNATGALNLAKVSESHGFDLLHVSTDYVFDGRKQAPYVETDLPRPLNVYAASKLAGEHFVLAYSSRSFVVRSSGLYGQNKCRAKGGRNFIDTMLFLASQGKDINVVNDEILTPTYTFHLAKQIRELANLRQYGLYHVTNNGSCSWFEFAREIFKCANLSPNLQPTSAAQFPSAVKRPSYSVLDNAALRSVGADLMPHWTESLQHYFRHRPVIV